MNLKLPDLVTKSVFDVVKENFHRVKLVFHHNFETDDSEILILTFTRLEKVTDRFLKWNWILVKTYPLKLLINPFDLLTLGLVRTGARRDAHSHTCLNILLSNGFLDV